MTKKEIIGTLVKEHGYKESELRAKKVIELNKILGSHINKNNIVVDDTIADAAEDNDTIEDTVDITTHSYQLNIFETKIEHLSDCRKVVFENIGAGDVYVSESMDGIFKKQNRIIPEESKEFSNVELLYVSSASRPVLKITYYR